MPTPSALASRLNRFVISSLENDSALDVRNHGVTHLGNGTSLVSWNSEDYPDLSNHSIEDIRSYLFFLDNQHYSLICRDGSILQMSFKVKRGEVIGHRLCFIPCPVEIDISQLQDASLVEIVKESIFSKNFDVLRQRGAIRFDYDPSAATDDHPAAHATINFDESRIPVGRVFDACSFLEFIDSKFLARNASLGRFSLPIARDENADVLALANRGEPHFTWQIA
jgi:hypothetical protein